MTAYILEDGDPDEEVIRNSFDSEASTVLNPKDIYMRLATNVELIDLYCHVN